MKLYIRNTITTIAIGTFSISAFASNPVVVDSSNYVRVMVSLENDNKALVEIKTEKGANFADCQTLVTDQAVEFMNCERLGIISIPQSEELNKIANQELKKELTNNLTILRDNILSDYASKNEVLRSSLFISGILAWASTAATLIPLGGTIGTLSAKKSFYGHLNSQESKSLIKSGRRIGWAVVAQAALAAATLSGERVITNSNVIKAKNTQEYMEALSVENLIRANEITLTESQMTAISPLIYDTVLKSLSNILSKLVVFADPASGTEFIGFSQD